MMFNISYKLLLVLLTIHCSQGTYGLEDNNTLKQKRSLTGVGNGLNGAGAIVNGVFKLLELPGKCCRSLFHDFCGDGTIGTPHCAYGRCNIAGCNCDGGCRGRKDGEPKSAILYEHKFFNAGLRGRGSLKNFKIASNECWNMEWWNDKASSIRILTGCVRVWEHHGCQGASTCICDENNDLRKISLGSGNWNDQISSMNWC